MTEEDFDKIYKNDEVTIMEDITQAVSEIHIALGNSKGTYYITRNDLLGKVGTI